MDRKARLILPLLIIGTILSSTVVVGYAFNVREDNLWFSLTKEQRAAIVSKVREMKSRDATPREIMREILTMLQEWGIKMPMIGPIREWLVIE